MGAVFQYEFRDDPAFPVGLASADLSHLSSTYRLWLAPDPGAGRVLSAVHAGQRCAQTDPLPWLRSPDILKLR